MLNYFYICLILNFLAPLMCALRCHYGKEIIHAFSKSVSGNNVECSEEESFCLRIESVGTQFSFPVNITTMMCATRDICNNPSCNELSNTVARSFYDNYDSTNQDYEGDSDYDRRMVLFQIRSCEVSCCQDNHCNMESIHKKKPTVRQENSSTFLSSLFQERKTVNIRSAAPRSDTNPSNGSIKPSFSTFSLILCGFVSLLSHFV